MKKLFNDLIKEEVISYEFSLEEFKTILIYYMKNNAFISYDKGRKQPYLQISSYNQKIIDFLSQNLMKHFQIATKILFPNQKQRIWKIQIYDEKNYEFLNLLINETPKNSSNKHGSKAVVIGLFLASGTICNFEKGLYHCEINFKDLLTAKTAHKIFNNLKIDNKILNYQNRLKIYIKKADAISDFLKLINAVNAMMWLEEVKISNDFLNQNQRLNNLDVANLSKVTKAALDQIQIIQYLKAHDLLKNLDQKTLDFMQERIIHPENSLKEISEILYKKYQYEISKSGLNHIVRKIRQISLKHSSELQIKK